MTRNFLLLVSTPPGVVTATEPVVAPLGKLAGSKRQQAAAFQSACAPADYLGHPDTTLSAPGLLCEKRGFYGNTRKGMLLESVS
jgi:hypothetical protein